MIRRLLVAALALVALPLHAQTFNLFKPANGILKGQTTTYVTTAAASSDVISLWSGTCNASSFLRGDGACAAAALPATVAYTDMENVFSVPQFISLGTPQLWLNENDVAANNRAWAFGASGGGACIFAASDDAMTVTNGLCFTRSGATITGATLTATSTITLTSPIVTGPLYFASVADNAIAVNATSTNGRISTYPYLSGRGWIQWTDETAAALNPATLQASDFAFSANGTGTLADFVFNGVALNAMPLLAANNTFTGTTNTFNDIVVDSCTGCGGGGGSPGGSDTQIQFNNMGAFGGSASLTWDGAALTTQDLVANGVATVMGLEVDGQSQMNGDIDVTGQVGAAGVSTNYKSGMFIENNDPRYLWIEDDASANEHAWEWGASGGTGIYWMCNDGAPATCNPIMTFARSGATPTTATFVPEIITPASTTTRAGLNLPHGSAPSSPVNGDTWTTSAGMFVRINGVTVGPLGVGSSVTTTGSFTATFDTACTTSPTIDFSWTKTGGIVHVSATASSGFPCTGDSTSFTTTGTPAPASIRPTLGAVSQVINDWTNNGTTSQAACIVINTAGNVAISRSASYGAICNAAGWTAAGNRDVPASISTVNWGYQVAE